MHGMHQARLPSEKLCPAFLQHCDASMESDFKGWHPMLGIWPIQDFSFQKWLCGKGLGQTLAKL